MNEALDSLLKIEDRIAKGNRISRNEALDLAVNAPLSLLGLIAVRIKEIKSGKNIYYNRNFHIEPTNICLFNCKFCSYRQNASSTQAWDYSIEQMLDMVRARKNSHATEVHIVGAVNQNKGLFYHAELISKIKEITPNLTIKGLSAVELDHMIKQAGVSLEEGLTILKNAGLATIPGGGAEIFDNDIRNKICPDKVSAEGWMKIHDTAHRLGIPSNATMLYGHIENWAQRIDHLDRLRSQQDKSNGFNAFIPLKYRMKGNSLSEVGEVGIVEDLRVLAISRIYLDNFDHIKAYWPMFGKTTTQLSLAFGADDIDGTIDDSTKIYSMAGAEDSTPRMSVEDMKKLIDEASYIPVERDSFYNPIKK